MDALDVTGIAHSHGMLLVHTKTATLTDLIKSGKLTFADTPNFRTGSLVENAATASKRGERDYVMPDCGVLTLTTFGVCVPTMLAFGPPELLRDLVPKVLAGEVLICQFFSEPIRATPEALGRQSFCEWLRSSVP